MTCKLVRAILAAVLLAFGGVDAAFADHLVVSRSAWVKDAPSSDAQALLKVDPKQKLQLLSPKQRNGYYEVELPEGGHGWVYRTLVRRFPGDLPRGSEVAGDASTPTVDEDRDLVFGVPSYGEDLQVLDNVGYTVGYSAQTKGPIWVGYHLFAVGNKKSPEREDLFAKDERVPSPVPASGYEGSGYDRGHMAPSAPIGRRYGKAAQDKTFLMTNMIPQVPGLNQRGWEAVESLISSEYAEDCGEVWVIVGPIFEGECKELSSGVRIPSHTFMVVIDLEEMDGSVRAMGIVMPQRRINAERLSLYVRTIDDIEARTGLDLLTELPDDVEQIVEASAPDSRWNINRVLQPRFQGLARPIRSRACGT